MATYDAALEVVTIVRAHPSDGDPILQNAEAEGYFTLDLTADPAGRLGMCTGAQKLANEILIAITEKRMMALLGAFNLQEFETLAHQRLEQFRSSQLRYVGENDPDLVGFDISRRDPVTGTYVKLTRAPAAETFVDTRVVPGVTYSYTIGRRSNRNPNEPIAIEKIDVTPPIAGSDLITDFDSCTVEVQPRSVTFFLPQNRTFRPDELLGNVLSVNVTTGADPRGVVLLIRLESGAGIPFTIQAPIPQSSVI